MHPVVRAASPATRATGADARLAAAAQAGDDDGSATGLAPCGESGHAAPLCSEQAPLVVVLNRRSGARRAHEAADLIERLTREAGRACRVHAVRRGAHVPAVARAAVEEARRLGGILVAAGGDGTLNAVAQEAYRESLPFAALPQGTFNYFGREHRLSLELEQALASLLKARPRAVQVGEVNGRLFLVNASVGLYPRVLEEREAATREHGRYRWVALWSGIRTVLRERRRLALRVELDGEPRLLEAATIFVGNNRVQLDRLGVAQAEALDHGQLVALWVRPLDPVSTLGLLWKGATGQLEQARAVESFGFRELEVQSLSGATRPRWLKVAIDGEVLWLRTPLRFRPAPRPLWLMAEPPGP